MTRLKFPVHTNRVGNDNDESGSMGSVETLLPVDEHICPSIIFDPMYQEPELKYTAGDCYPFMSAGNYSVTEI